MRQRSTKRQVEGLDKAILDLLDKDHPQTVRQLFYAAAASGSVSLTMGGYRRVATRSAVLRRNGEVPFEWLPDDARRRSETWSSPADFLRAQADLFRVDVWAASPVHVEVWCVAGVAGALRDVCDYLRVPLYPCGGYLSLSALSAAAASVEREAGGRLVRIFSVDDYGRDAPLIVRRAVSGLRRFLAGTVVVEPELVAVTEAQAEHLPRSPAPAIPTLLRPRGSHRVECAAVPAAELRCLVGDAVSEFLPDGAREEAEEAEGKARALILDLADRVGGK